MEDAPRSLRRIYRKHWTTPTLLVVTTILLGFGLFMPLLKIEKMVFWRNQYSVATGVFGLWDDEQYVLAAIVFFWSVAFPIAKLTILFWIWFRKLDAEKRSITLKRLELLGKWSMLDVYIVAVMIVAVKLGPIAEVTPENGIYVFAGAVVLSMLVTARVERMAREADGLEA